MYQARILKRDREIAKAARLEEVHRRREEKVKDALEERARKLKEKKLRAKASDLGRRLGKIKRNRVSETKHKAMSVSGHSTSSLAEYRRCS